MSVPLWRRVLAWLRGLFSRQRLLGTSKPQSATWGEHIVLVPEDIRKSLEPLAKSKGIVKHTVENAVADYCHLYKIIVGPGAGADAVFDATLLADAEITLREIVEGAPALQTIIAIAEKRRGDQAGREAAGEAILKLRDRAQLLSDTASAALQWAATPDKQSLDRVRDRAQKLASA